MANKAGHRRFGNVRRRESGRYQIRYQGPDGRMRSYPETFARKSDAYRLLSLIEAQVTRGEWTDPDRARVKLGHYAETWIAQRPGLRPRTRDLYQWLLIRHIAPYLGGLPLGTIETQTLREWRARLLDQGISVTMTAKAYRLLRAVLTTAVVEDKILARNPCQIRGAGSELAAERPVLTVAQVFHLAEHVGRRPIGNIRKLRAGGYRLRCQQTAVMVTVPTIFASRSAADEALWAMADHGQADWKQDQRYRALILLATFASLRWGEVTALRRCDLELVTGTVLVRASFTERSTGEILLGPPKSKAGRRIVAIPEVILPVLRDHLSSFSRPETDALVFPGLRGGPLRRGNFNKMAAWPRAARAIGAPGLHFHDLRHTGNTFAAASGAGLKDLMARMGHDSERAALVYQHQAQGADRSIAVGIDAHVIASRLARDGQT